MSISTITDKAWSMGSTACGGIKAGVCWAGRNVVWLGGQCKGGIVVAAQFVQKQWKLALPYLTMSLIAAAKFCSTPIVLLVAVAGGGVVLHNKEYLGTNKQKVAMVAVVALVGLALQGTILGWFTPLISIAAVSV